MRSRLTARKNRHWVRVGLLCAAVFFVPSVAATTRAFPGASPCNTTLQACINGSLSGDTINIATNTYTLPEISVGKALTLNGSGVGLVTLQPDGAHRVLHTAPSLSAGVTLSNLTITGGACASATTQSGGGIFADTGTPLHLDTVDVKNNTCATNSGGGIEAIADTTLNDVNVVGNTDPGGAGGGLRASGNVTITGGRFESNSSFNSGGGMRVTGTLTMTNVIVLNNSHTNTAVGADGGGIRADGGLTMTGCTVQGNTSTNLGGGVYATDATIGSSTFQSNSAKSGGGLYATGTVAITDTLFDTNSATSGVGGGVDVEGSAQTTLTGTSAASTMTFNKNSSTLNGGGILTAGFLKLIGKVTFTLNKSTAGSGGAIHADTVLDNFDASLVETFVGNTAFANGGAVAADADVTLESSPVFSGNIAGGGTAGDGGGVYAGGQVELANVVANGNQGRNGGVAYATGPMLILTGTLGSKAGAANVSAMDGGCVYSGGGSLEADSTSFIKCTAGGRGGAAFAATGSAVLTGSFQSNHADGDGGGVYASQISLNSFSASYNSAGGSGGVAFSSGAMTATNSDFFSNSAGSQGGALSAGALTVTGSNFTSNSAANSDGGAISLSADSEIRSSTFVTNQASQCAGIKANFTGTLYNVNVFGSLFTGDTATTFQTAADVCAVKVALTVVNNTFDGSGAAGSISVLEADGGTISARNNIVANYAVGVGTTDSGSEDYNDFFNAPALGVANGGHSVAGDPRFRDPAGGNFRLQASSPAIDAGDNSAVPVDLTTDLDGLARREDIPGVPDTGVGPAPVVDIGAYELHDVIFQNGFEP